MIAVLAFAERRRHSRSIREHPERFEIAWSVEADTLE
jgi:hypothetical protein